MVLPAKVKNGVIVLDDGRTLPDGTEVSVSVLSHVVGEEQKRGKTLFDRLQKVIGKAEGGPPDGSINIDHYLYGHPKR